MDDTPFVHLWRILLISVVVITAIVVVVAFMLQSKPSFPYEDPRLSIDERVADLMSRMTIQEKIGQMALVEKNSIKRSVDIHEYALGGILSGAGAKPENNTRRGWREMIGEFVAASRRSRLGIPILYGVDANHGHGNVPQATMFPHAIGLGATHNAELIERIGEVVAQESLALSTHWIFAPSLDLPRDIRWGRVYESFGSDASTVSVLSAAFIRGLQSEMIAASAKHFLGSGSMVWGSSTNANYSIDQGLVLQNEKALSEEYLPPFKAAVDAGVLSVMVGLGSYGDSKLSANRYLITDILKNEFGFEGIVVSDWYGVYDIAEDKYEAAVAGINAGIDMVMLPYEYELFTRDVRRAVENGDISEERIDDAVERILRVKFALGLFDAEPAQTLALVGSLEHRALAREAVSQSLVLLKDAEVLPLKTETIRVAGSAADNVGIQSGAWTVEWQGIDGNWLEHGTSILQGIREAASSSVEYAIDGRFEGGRADVGIAVVGEKPYAEGWGDNPHPRLSTEDLAAIEQLRETVDTLIVIIISGRPLIITDQIEGWDTVIAAWLPGPEGAGIADVLFGTKPFTGTLPLPWPLSIEQLPLNSDDIGVDGTTPLYPRGYGL